MTDLLRITADNLLLPDGIELCSHPLLPPKDFDIARAAAISTIHGGPVIPHAERFAFDVAEATGVTWISTYEGHHTHRTEALDVFVAPARYDADPTLGNAVCDFAIANRHRYGIRYVISRRRILNFDIADYWRAMASRGDPTQDHYDHVHLTFKAEVPTQEDDMYDDGDRAKLDQVVADVGHLKTVFDEFKREQTQLWGQPNWHLTGEAGNTVIAALFNTLGDMKTQLAELAKKHK